MTKSLRNKQQNFFYVLRNIPLDDPNRVKKIQEALKLLPKMKYSSLYNLTHANLGGITLHGADLSCADLSYANLSSVTLGDEPLVAYLEKINTAFTTDFDNQLMMRALVRGTKCLEHSHLKEGVSLNVLHPDILRLVDITGALCDGRGHYYRKPLGSTTLLEWIAGATIERAVAERLLSLGNNDWRFCTLVGDFSDLDLKSVDLRGATLENCTLLGTGILPQNLYKSLCNADTHVDVPAISRKSLVALFDGIALIQAAKTSKTPESQDRKTWSPEYRDLLESWYSDLSDVLSMAFALALAHGEHNSAIGRVLIEMVGDYTHIRKGENPYVNDGGGWSNHAQEWLPVMINAPHDSVSFALQEAMRVYVEYADLDILSENDPAAFHAQCQRITPTLPDSARERLNAYFATKNLAPLAQGASKRVVTEAAQAATRQLTAALVYKAMKIPDSGITAATVDFQQQYPAGSQPIIDGIRKAVLAVVQFNEEEGTVRFETPNAASLDGSVPEALREVVIETIAVEQEYVKRGLMQQAAAGLGM